MYYLIVNRLFCSTSEIQGLQPGWHTFPTDDGLANEAVRAVIATPDGAVWFGTSDGITFYLLETTAE